VLKAADVPAAGLNITTLAGKTVFIYRKRE
jgi:hypothetical protein